MAMRIVFKKIPKLAVGFYCCGFLMLSTALFCYFYRPDVFSVVVLQQLFIAGAIIVALGSVINSIYQFKPREKTKNIK